MKKLVSSFLALAILSSMIVTVHADIASSTSGIPNPMALQLEMEVEASEKGAEIFTNPCAIQIPANAPKGVDYMVTLNMEPVRALFDKNFIQNLLVGTNPDPALVNEFKAGVVNTAIDVRIDYPATATISNIMSAGGLEVASIYSETGRVQGTNSIVISFKNVDNLSVNELQAYYTTYLADLKFALRDSVTYEASGAHRVDVSLSGQTVIAFTSKTQTVTYQGAAYNIVNAAKVGESGGGLSGAVINFNSNGGSEVPKQSIRVGDILKEPEVTREGYILEGWYTDASFTEKYDFSKPVKSGLTLYAKWIEDTHGDDWWFLDVPKNMWYYEPIRYAYYNGLMVGTSKDYFEPQSPITRAMFVTILHRIEGEPEVTPTTFVDVEKDSWYDKGVSWAQSTGVTVGVSETEFAPDTPITREQISAMIYRYAKYKGYDVSAGENADIQSYTDADEITPYAVPAVKWAVGDGIMTGRTETTLVPLKYATRAETAALLSRVVEKYAK